MAMETKQAVDDRLTIKEAAKFAKVHTTTVRSWMDKGKLKYQKTGTERLKIKMEDLKAFLSIE